MTNRDMCPTRGILFYNDASYLWYQHLRCFVDKTTDQCWFLQSRMDVAKTAAFAADVDSRTQRPAWGAGWTWLVFPCFNLGLSENRVYSQWNSHLIGIMISKTIGSRGTLFSDKPIYGKWMHMAIFNLYVSSFTWWKVTIFLVAKPGHLGSWRKLSHVACSFSGEPIGHELQEPDAKSDGTSFLDLFWSLW